MRILPSALLAAILFACPAVAQAVYGNVYGRITDQSGALIASARITILDVARGNLVQTASNAFGNYMVTHLAPGDYNVRGQAPGFKSKTVLQVRVFADQGARVDLQLEIGGQRLRVQQKLGAAHVPVATPAVFSDTPAAWACWSAW